MNWKNNLQIILFLLLLFKNPLYARNIENENIVPIATYKNLFSNVLNEERTIAVSLPTGYEYSKKHYPVLYILDAEYASYPSAVGMIQYLGRYKIPEMIIIGILNTNRNRDLWSHQIEGLPSTKGDGADNFINFLSQELIPFVNRNYRTTAHKTIYGRSAAGHFVTYCLISKPELFEAYLASSPVIGFSDNQLLTKAEAFFKNQKTLTKSFYVYYGDTDYNSVIKRIPTLESIIEHNRPAGFLWGVKRVEGKHGPPESLYELLLMLYPDWHPIIEPVILPSKGEFLQGKSIEVKMLAEQDSIIYYTCNGEEPSRNSARYECPIRIEKPTILKAKSIRNDLQESRTVEAQFTESDQVRPALKVKNIKNGLKYTYVEKQAFHIPDRILEPPLKSGIIPSIDLSVRERDQFYLLQFEGFIKIPSTGQYRFYFLAIESKLFIDESQITEAHGLLPKETVVELSMEAGIHAFRIVSCILTHQNHKVELFWESPGIRKQRIPASAWYHNASNNGN